jgi:hypothetical protein
MFSLEPDRGAYGGQQNDNENAGSAFDKWDLRADESFTISHRSFAWWDCHAKLFSTQAK